MMEIKVERISKAYRELIKSDDYKNYEKNVNLLNGKSTDVFFNDVLARVNLQFMGKIVDQNGIFRSEHGKLSLKSLVVGDDILSKAISVYTEFATDKEPSLSIENEYTESFKINSLTRKLIENVSACGSTLVKGVHKEGKISLITVPRNRFFVVKNIVNPNEVEAIGIFGHFDVNDERIMRVELYTDGKTEYKEYKVSDESLMAKADYSPAISYKGWQVGLIESESLFTNDLISNVREVIVNDTLTSQGFAKVARPILVVNEEITEYDEEDKETLNMEDGIFKVKEISASEAIKQVSLETKTEEWKSYRDKLEDKIYTSLAINRRVLGLVENGGVASGTAHQKGMQRTISRVNKKRGEAYEALETVINWGNGRLNGTNLDLKITGQKIIEITKKEELENEKLKVDSEKIRIDTILSIEEMELEERFKKAINDKKNELINEYLGVE